MTELIDPKLCTGCGQDLVMLKDGFTVCPTEDSVQKQEILPKLIGVARDEIIVLDGERLVNPFGHKDARIKTLFDRAHDVKFAQNKDEWYPEQRRDWGAA